MINVLGPDIVQSMQDSENRERAQAEDEAGSNSEKFVSGLSAYVSTRWEKALRAKNTTETIMLNSLRQRNGQYDSAKLSAINKLGGSKAFIMLTDTKCRSGVAWMKDILFQPGTKPWSVDPTPKPELPPELETEIRGRFMTDAMAQSSQELFIQGLPYDDISVMTHIQQKYPNFEADLEKAYYDTAKEMGKKAEIKLDDQLLEGGWYFALEQCLDDIATLKACILKGPILRMEKVRFKELDQFTGEYKMSVKEKIVPTFERRSPFNIYPAPDSTGVEDGYLFDKITLSRKQLYDMIKLPGFDEEAIRRVLQNHREGELKDWTTLESEKASIEGKDSTSVFETDKIDCLELWDTIPGNLLREWGLDEEDVPDEDDSYPACVWMIGKEVVKAMLNYDQFGKKPFSVTSFEVTEDSFWGKGIPELIADIQGICNAVVRAIVNNVGIASGPQIEINKQRVAPGFPLGLHPWKVWETTDMGIATAPALKVYNIPLNADNLIQVFQHFVKLADENSGVPGYAHGDAGVGGAGNTASGLSMLMTHAARGIKSVIRNIDNYLIAKSIEKLYYFNMDYMPEQDMVFDMNIVARGSSSLIAKEQQAVRLTEFAQSTNNPVDLQIMGLEGRRNLLLQAAKANEIETDKVIPDRPPSPPQMPMQQPGMPMDPNAQSALPGVVPPGANPPAPASLDASGGKSQGEDFRTIKQNEVPQMRT